MLDSVERFTSRVENYSKYRPGYPAAIVELLVADCGLTAQSIIADIGSGTGFLSELFLDNGNKVFGVEPNEGMRRMAEARFGGNQHFVSVKGAAESTTLAENSIDFVTAGQAFHWFDQDKTRNEFLRILKPNGWAVIVWNERRLDSTPFLRDYEQFLIRFGTDYQRVRHENVKDSMAGFFRSDFKVGTFDNSQHLDLQGLEGRVSSASYTPAPSDPNYAAMIDQLQSLFTKHQQAGKVIIEYDTKVYYGRLQ